MSHVHSYASFLYIDECFADLTGVPGDLVRVGREMRARVLRCTGIPVGVGIGTSKTLAKLANHGAKKWQAQTGGVLEFEIRRAVIDCCRPARLAMYGASADG